MDDRARMIEAWRAREVPDAHARARMLARLRAPIVSRRTVIALGLAMAIAATVLLAIAGVGRLLPRRLAERSDQAVHEATAPAADVATPVATPPARPSAPVVAPIVAAPPPEPARAVARRDTAPTRVVEQSSPPAASVSDEARVLAAAQAALRDGDAPRALDELDAYARRFPHGTMRAERDALHVIALCSAGRRDEGVRAATSVLADRSTISYAPRIRRACGL